MTGITRRTALTAALGTAGAGAVALGLAACSPTTASDGGGEPGSITPSTDASGAQTLALSQVPVGGSIAAAVAGQPVVVSQPKAGQVKAFSAICTHQGCVIAPAGAEFDCPCHGSRFDATTGKPIQGPATLPLDAVAATVSGDTITFS